MFLYLFPNCSSSCCNDLERIWKSPPIASCSCRLVTYASPRSLIFVTSPNRPHHLPLTHQIHSTTMALRPGANLFARLAMTNGSSAPRINLIHTRNLSQFKTVLSFQGFPKHSGTRFFSFSSRSQYPRGSPIDQAIVSRPSSREAWTRFGITAVRSSTSPSN